MRFMVSLITDGAYMKEAAPEQVKELGGKMMEFMQQLREADVLLDPGAPLASGEAARTLRYGEDGKVVVTDGPFAESKEQVAGYMVLECKDLDEAVAWVRKMPVRGSSVEVRPIAEPPQGQ